jgi:hypothetical protein
MLAIVMDVMLHYSKLIHTRYQCIVVFEGGKRRRVQNKTVMYGLFLPTMEETTPERPLVG